MIYNDEIFIKYLRIGTNITTDRTKFFKHFKIFFTSLY